MQMSQADRKDNRRLLLFYFSNDVRGTPAFSEKAMPTQVSRECSVNGNGVPCYSARMSTKGQNDSGLRICSYVRR